MKAAIVYSAGKLPEYSDFIEPPVDADHVMINVKAAAVSQLVKSRTAGTHYSSKMQYPFIAGIDGTGYLSHGEPVYFLSFGTLVEVPSLTATEQGEKRKSTGWLLKIDSDSLIFEAWDFYRHQPLAAFHHKVSLPQLPALVKKIASVAGYLRRWEKWSATCARLR